MTSSLTTALEEMTINNEQLRREVDLVKAENRAVKDENDKQKDEIGQLTTLLDKMAVNNENQMQQINSQSSEIATMRDEIGWLRTQNQQLKQIKANTDKQKDENKQLRTEVDMIKAENVQQTIENDDLRGCVRTNYPPQQLVLKQSTTPGDLFSGPVKIKWEEGAPAPVGCADHTAVWLNGLVYVGSGNEAGVVESYTINCYDPVKNSWSYTINTPYCLFAMTKLNNKLIIAGGWDKRYKVTNRILKMDDGQLKNYTKMTKTRTAAAAVGHQGMLIITGGVDDKDRTLFSTELFDSTNGQWYTCSDLPQPHYWLESVIVDNILYMLGGSDKDNRASTAVFSTPLDNLSKHQLKWNTHKDTPWCWSAPVSVNGTQLLIVGGIKKMTYDYTRTSDVHKLNKVNHNWETIGNIPSSRESSSAVSTPDNRVIVIGGYNDKGEITNTVWIGSCEPQ